MELRLFRFTCAALASLIASLALAGCDEPATRVDGPQAQYAGLEEAILTWRGDIAKSAACTSKADGPGCQSFDVGCKGERPPVGGETARVVVAMSWDAWNPKTSDFGPASGLSEFHKAGGKWTRQNLPGPVNLSTCATSAG